MYSACSPETCASPLQKHGVALDGIDRRLELMGDIGHKIPLQHLRGRQFSRHLVEMLIDFLNLSHPAARLQPHLEVSPGHLSHGPPQPADGLQNPVGEEGGDKAADQHAQKNQPQQGNNPVPDIEDLIEHIKNAQQNSHDQDADRQNQHDKIQADIHPLVRSLFRL